MIPNQFRRFSRSLTLVSINRWQRLFGRLVVPNLFPHIRFLLMHSSSNKDTYSNQRDDTDSCAHTNSSFSTCR